MKKTALFLAVLALTGCTNKVWKHNYRSTQDFYRDSARCEAMSSGGNVPMVYGGSPLANGYNQGLAISAAGSGERVYSHCMKGEGWYLVDKR